MERRDRNRRWFCIGRLAVLAGVICLVAPVAPSRAAPTAQQREMIGQASRTISDAGKLFVEKKYRESGELVKEAQEQVAKLAVIDDPAVQRAVENLKSRLTKAHALLQLQGIKLPALVIPKPTAKPAGDPPAGNTPAGDPAAGDEVSFRRDVAPMLVAKCGRCHISDSKGKLSVTSYESLLRGSEAGVVVMPGMGKGSRIVEVIVEGDMPRGGVKVTPAELALLTRWIDQGAKCDAPATDTPLRQLTRQAAQRDAPKVEIAQPTGKETVSFAGDIAPALAKACSNCHGNRQPRGNFNLTTFASMARGGDSGRVVVPGKPAESLLLARIKGEGGDRMPLRQPPLGTDVIAKIEKWIAEGATFDGQDAQLELARVALLHRATHATHEDLSAQRIERAKQNWGLALPDREPAIVESDQLLIYGTVPKDRLEKLAGSAAEEMKKVAGVLHAPADQPLIKGRLTLFTFDRRFDYSEFGQMVEKRGLPRAWRGHWRFDIVDAYGCVVTPRSDEYALEPLLAQQLAGVYVASCGIDVPDWFAEGSARAVAARLYARDPRIRAWKDQIPGTVARSGPDGLLGGKLPPEQSHVIAYGFVDSLFAKSTKYHALLKSLRGGVPFERAFATVYRDTPQNMAVMWAQRAAR